MYIDTHAHIYLEQFKDEYSDIVERALASQVNQILMPNIDLDSISGLFGLNHRFPEVCRPMIGLHPCSINATYLDQLDRIKAHLNREGVIAVGEIGIDLYWDKTFHKEQEDAFRRQIQWSKDYDIPIVIDSRNSIVDTIRIVEELQDGSLRCVFHCFGVTLSAEIK